MTIEYHGAPPAGTSIDRLFRVLADEFAAAKFSVVHNCDGDMRSLDLTFAGRSVAAKLTLTDKPSTHWEVRRN